MTAECARCGNCCDPVIVAFDPKERAAELLADPNLEPHNRHNAEFLRDHWTSESTFESPTALDEDGRPLVAHRVRCDAFDRDTRLCTAHDNRPPICSAYPWYGTPREEWAGSRQADALVPQCSYNADVRTMLPIVEVR